MKVKKIVAEDFVHYKKPSMVVAFATCSWKCCMDVGQPASMCQNEPLAQMKDIEVTPKEIYEMYFKNDIVSALVMAGLEPMDQYGDVYGVVKYFRKMGCKDDIVIYTGYNKEEVMLEVAELMEFENIIFKFGRFIPNQNKHYDEVLGVELASDNQKGERI